MNKKLVVLLRHFENKYTSVVPDKEGLAESLIANDVVPVVRCKGCISHKLNGRCALLDIVMGGNDFCSYGERREGE